MCILRCSGYHSNYIGLQIIQEIPKINISSDGLCTDNKDIGAHQICAKYFCKILEMSQSKTHLTYQCRKAIVRDLLWILKGVLDDYLRLNKNLLKYFTIKPNV